jgi:hypothetical protein
VEVGPDQSQIEEKKGNHCHILAMVIVETWSISLHSQIDCRGKRTGPLTIGRVKMVVPKKL